MNYSFSTDTFIKKQTILDEALKWFSNLGIKVSKSRIEQYKKDVDFVLEAVSKNNIDSLTTDEYFMKVINSFVESDELIFIYEGISDINDLKVWRKVPTLFKGPLFITDELIKSSSNRARDIEFELFVTSLFSKSGFNFDFSTEADLVLKNSDLTIFIECKRPNSIKSLSANVRKASKQLKKRYQLKQYLMPKYGIIFLSVEKILNPDHFFLIADDETEIDFKIREKVNRFVDQNQNLWYTIKEAQTLGVIIFFKTIAIQRKSKIFTTCRYLSIVNINAPNSIETKTLLNIVNNLTKTVIPN